MQNIKDWVASIRGVYFLTVLEVGSLRLGCQHGQVLGGLSSWFADGAFMLYPYTVKREI